MAPSMLSSLRSLILGEDFRGDPLSQVLQAALSWLTHGRVSLDVKQVSQYLTLAFVGFVSTNSLRAFIKQLGRVRGLACVVALLWWLMRNMLVLSCACVRVFVCVRVCVCACACVLLALWDLLQSTTESRHTPISTHHPPTSGVFLHVWCHEHVHTGPHRD